MLANIALIICVVIISYSFFYYGLITFTALKHNALTYKVIDALENIVTHLKFIIPIAIFLAVIRWLIY